MRHIKFNRIRSYILSESKQDLYFNMNLKSKHKGNLVADGCADVSVAEILYGFVEVLCTERKFTLAVVDHYL